MVETVTIPVNGEDAIVTAAFVKSESGYQRIQIIPKAEGETGITVADGSGSSILLRVKVDECLEIDFGLKRKTVSWLPEKLQKNKRRIFDAFTGLLYRKGGDVMR